MGYSMSSYYFYLTRHSTLLQLKKDLKAVKHIQEQSGFGWDDTNHIVTAPPDIWDSYLQV